MFLIGILGFILNRKNIALSVSSIKTMLLFVTFLVLISSFGSNGALGQLFGVHIITIAGAMWIIRFRILGCFLFVNPQNILIIMLRAPKLPLGGLGVPSMQLLRYSCLFMENPFLF
jgi:NADH-ubiquinone oxidoreductase chain 4L